MDELFESLPESVKNTIIGFRNVEKGADLDHPFWIRLYTKISTENYYIATKLYQSQNFEVADVYMRYALAADYLKQEHSKEVNYESGK